MKPSVSWRVWLGLKNSLCVSTDEFEYDSYELHFFGKDYISSLECQPTKSSSKNSSTSSTLPPCLKPSKTSLWGYKCWALPVSFRSNFTSTIGNEEKSTKIKTITTFTFCSNNSSYQSPSTPKNGDETSFSIGRTEPKDFTDNLSYRGNYFLRSGGWRKGCE